jgi:hypothetical protein
MPRNLQEHVQQWRPTGGQLPDMAGVTASEVYTEPRRVHSPSPGESHLFSGATAGQLQQAPHPPATFQSNPPKTSSHLHDQSRARHRHRWADIASGKATVLTCAQPAAHLRSALQDFHQGSGVSTWVPAEATSPHHSSKPSHPAASQTPSPYYTSTTVPPPNDRRYAWRRLHANTAVQVSVGSETAHMHSGAVPARGLEQRRTSVPTQVPTANNGRRGLQAHASAGAMGVPAERMAGAVSKELLEPQAASGLEASTSSSQCRSAVAVPEVAEVAPAAEGMQWFPQKWQVTAAALAARNELASTAEELVVPCRRPSTTASGSRIHLKRCLTTRAQSLRTPSSYQHKLVDRQSSLTTGAGAQNSQGCAEMRMRMPGAPSTHAPVATHPGTFYMTCASEQKPDGTGSVQEWTIAIAHLRAALTTVQRQGMQGLRTVVGEAEPDPMGCGSGTWSTPPRSLNVLTTPTAGSGPQKASTIQPRCIRPSTAQPNSQCMTSIATKTWPPRPRSAPFVAPNGCNQPVPLLGRWIPDALPRDFAMLVCRLLAHSADDACVSVPVATGMQAGSPKPCATQAPTPEHCDSLTSLAGTIVACISRLAHACMQASEVAVTARQQCDGLEKDNTLLRNTLAGYEHPQHRLVPDQARLDSACQAVQLKQCKAGLGTEQHEAAAVNTTQKVLEHELMEQRARVAEIQLQASRSAQTTTTTNAREEARSQCRPRVHSAVDKDVQTVCSHDLTSVDAGVQTECCHGSLLHVHAAEERAASAERQCDLLRDESSRVAMREAALLEAVTSAEESTRSVSKRAGTLEAEVMAIRARASAAKQRVAALEEEASEARLQAIMQEQLTEVAEAGRAALMGQLEAAQVQLEWSGAAQAAAEAARDIAKGRLAVAEAALVDVEARLYAVEAAYAEAEASRERAAAEAAQAQQRVAAALAQAEAVRRSAVEETAEERQVGSVAPADTAQVARLQDCHATAGGGGGIVVWEEALQGLQHVRCASLHCQPCMAPHSRTACRVVVDWVAAR